MHINQQINQLISIQDDRALYKIFLPNNIELLDQVEPALIVYPFSKTLIDYKKYLIEETLENLIDLLKSCVEVEQYARVVKQIIKNALIFLEKNKSKAEDTRRISNALFLMLKQIKNQKILTFISNILCLLCLEVGNYRMVYDLVKIYIPTRKTLQYYIYHYYKGIIELYFEEFESGLKSLLEACRDYRIMDITDTAAYSVNILGFHMIKAAPHCIPQELTSLDEIMNKGLIALLDNYFPSEIYEKLHLFRLAKIYMPLCCVRNLIKRLFLSNNQNTRIDLSLLSDLCSKDQNEIYCLVLNCIQKGIIRGYLSINKSTLVLSKANPFPDLFNFAAN